MQTSNKPLSLGEKIRDIRLSQGLKQNALARQAHIAISTMSAFERDERRPAENDVRSIAEALGLTYDELIIGTSYTIPDPVITVYGTDRMYVNISDSFFSANANRQLTRKDQTSITAGLEGLLQDDSFLDFIRSFASYHKLSAHYFDELSQFADSALGAENIEKLNPLLLEQLPEHLECCENHKEAFLNISEKLYDSLCKISELEYILRAIEEKLQST